MLNIHPSLLPRHRGIAAVEWTIREGDAIAGGTVYHLSDRLDAGAGVSHYETFGRAEGREPDNFNAAQYLANYSDLEAAFGNNLDAAAQHYILHGHAEGRTDQASAVTQDFLL